ncbi:MAG: hypothetical protein KAT83_01350 [Candidatus Aenigmarchaeota archaeon]|nr:hypothetical protein [Candidatus Aenigmarchaeota archaeon]
MRYTDSINKRFFGAVEKDTAEYVDARKSFLDLVKEANISASEKQYALEIVGLKDVERAEYILTQRRLGEPEAQSVIRTVRNEADSYVIAMFNVASIALDCNQASKFCGVPNGGDRVKNGSDWDAEFHRQYTSIEEEYANALKEFVGEQVV